MFFYYFIVVCLFIAAFVFLIVGIDDFIFDVFYWVRLLLRKLSRKYPPLSLKTLENKEEKPIAIFIPCWQESNVIGDMLKLAIKNIYYNNYVLFVGLYPNDPESIAAVKELDSLSNKIVTLLAPHDGPTTKADNLNAMYKGMVTYEKRHGFQFEIIVLHDAEDIIHPYSLKIFNHLMPRKQAIQLPVIPLAVPATNWVHWSYNDEFAEMHTKTMFARENINGLVPSAGVGTAIAREALEIKRASSKEGFIFNPISHAEDYSLTLDLLELNIRTIFVQQFVKSITTRKKWGFFGPLVYRTKVERVATRSMFPFHYYSAVKQKARWITGITLDEWRYPGIHKKSWGLLYTFFLDHKALVSHLMSFVGYIILGYYLVYLAGLIFFGHDIIPIFIPADHWLWIILIIDFFLMCNRMLQRAIAVTRVYSFGEGLLAIPRLLVGTIINFHALVRALRIFFNNRGAKRSNEPHKKVWIKTVHSFLPMHTQDHFMLHLGELALHHGKNEKNILSALERQSQVKNYLGEILKEGKYHVSEEEVLKCLAILHKMVIFNRLPTIFPTEEEIKNRCSPQFVKILAKERMLLLAFTPSYIEIGVPYILEIKEQVAFEKEHSISVLWRFLTPQEWEILIHRITGKKISAGPPHPLMGELLLNAHIIDTNQLNYALEKQKNTGSLLGEVMIAEKIITQDSITSCLARQLEASYEKKIPKSLPSPELLRAFFDYNLLRKCKKQHVFIIGMYLELAYPDHYNSRELEKLKKDLIPCVLTCIPTEKEYLKILKHENREFPVFKKIKKLVGKEIEIMDVEINLGFSLKENSDLVKKLRFDFYPVRVNWTIFDDKNIKALHEIFSSL